MDKLEMRHTLLAAKARKKMSWDDIGKRLACRQYGSLPPATA